MPKPNHFTYNTSTHIEGTLQKGRLAIGILDIDYGGSTFSTPGNKEWINGSETNNQVHIYVDSYSIGRTSEQMATLVVKKSSDLNLSSVCALINQLPDIPHKFYDFLSSYEWLQQDGKYLLQNTEIKPFITKDLYICLEPSHYSSYPGVGNKIWNLGERVDHFNIIGSTFITELGGVIRTDNPTSHIISNNLSNQLDSEFSFFCWVKIESSGVILSEQDSTYLNQDFRFASITVNNQNKFTFAIYSQEGLRGFIDDTPRIINKWYQVGVRYNSQSKKFFGFVNGEEVGSIDQIIKENSENGNRYLLFGAICDISILGASTNSGNFDFSLIQIYDKSISNQMIKENYNLTKPRFD